ncbi:RluA family pseudouridine synthase [Lederbergia wuyishanensis]|uniref:Pseudouridine synthase n=1 Tax=Lederbergia wuyishanensis TaxID=1347903 RepID=A0ABU0CZ05_9BACI|nr:RluA family pseudouridine synthase [Lederbergia wuyishanensis]MCJ8006009.1 RluA family pseudouridine synthase [Lederbergia wuyishanensis]MDQ0341376.1 23S rRNA pseudouridine1911/1915/1917 synthase [Lederbergia wuyishanensis]
MDYYSLKWTIEKADAGQIIKEFLYTKGISRRALTNIKFTGGSIKVNGEEQNVRYLLKEFDVLIVDFPPEELNERMKGENIPLSIYFEDQDIIVLEKPPYMSTIPSREHPTGSLANALVYYYERTNNTSAIHIVTRLDRNTSGLVLIAKHRHAHHLLSLQQQNGKIQRYYEAFAEKAFDEISGCVDVPIGRKQSSIIEREVREDGQKAVTYFEVIRNYPEFSHIRLKLETGRTHQIRVHMSYLGHPLLGDDLYGGNQKIIGRQALHCRELCFEHPITRKELSFIAPLPLDMETIIKKENV